MKKTNRKKIIQYMILMLGTVAVCVLVLFLASFAPGERIALNLRYSSLQIKYEGDEYSSFDHAQSSRLDNSTDSIMLMESESLNSNNLSAIFENPCYMKKSAEVMDPVHDIYSYTYGEECEQWMYPRYWMGFRAFLRIALVFFNYFEIRHYVGLAVLILFIFALTSVAKYSDLNKAFWFGISIILVRPQIICSSLQFCTCFLISFTAMLCIPWLYKHQNYERHFFLLIGMLTMYFDFYTVPLITLCLPLIYLTIMRQESLANRWSKDILGDCFIWLLGYIFMWIAKLTLTTIFTPINGFKNGFHSFILRVGIQKDPDLIEFYNPLLAIKNIWNVLAVDKRGNYVLIFVIVLIIGILLYLQKKKRFSFANMLSVKPIVFISMLPIIWFLITAQPINIHAWFQYRTIVVSFWAVGIMINEGFCVRNCKTPN